MFYYLFNYLDKLDFPGAGMFQYVSFRSSMAVLFALLISTIIGRKIIDILQLKQVGEVVRDLGVEGQLSKKGTPTMGGIIIIISILIPVLLFARLHNIYIILMIITTIWLGFVGFVDDYIKVFKKNKEGLSGKAKIVGQVGLGLIVGLALYLSPDVMIRENAEIRKNDVITSVEHSPAVKSTKTTIPFMKNNNFDYRDLASFMTNHRTAATWIIFVIITIFIVTAVSNGANLTDGLDGLAAGNSAIIGVTLGILAYVSSHVEYAAYLNIMYIPHCEELVIFASAFIGATVGFLWYNAYPAQVFMGDTGSLTLGGIIAVFAIIIHKELLLPILCGIFFVESLSVMMQVSYFKYTKKKTGVGKRIFKMTPIHHHFQKPGNAGIDAIWQKPLRPVPESKIVVRFWLVGIILAVLTIATLKMR
ncbi:phospho-N-acetylmuramoyl-pentapeptide-transferase [Bacteroidia bacterium]|nr:phospho-N-acetylmuramoyl-pentapeptide-transferase [Bacteroidia bacterium]GHU91159.1 phospho-N-acetylmuramoyl-pentapeptide-transferase [Bacteroidia bacterium]GHV20271.1 phospho-N-acetylmuramoyl-pentapeptide-transferase [Bacteroidia bacterium]